MDIGKGSPAKCLQVDSFYCYISRGKNDSKNDEILFPA